jgi:hypothetical protein
MVPLSAKKVICIEANNTIPSFSPVDYMLQVNFQEGEPYLMQCAFGRRSRLVFKQI